jgi:hypothetical protein
MFWKASTTTATIKMAAAPRMSQGEVRRPMLNLDGKVSIDLILRLMGKK